MEKQIETATTSEYTKAWKDLSSGEALCCLAAHCVPVGLSWKNQQHMATMKRLFDLGQPKVTFATDGSYCRITDDESKKVMVVLMREYL